MACVAGRRGVVCWGCDACRGEEGAPLVVGWRLKEGGRVQAGDQERDGCGR